MKKSKPENRKRMAKTTAKTWVNDLRGGNIIEHSNAVLFEYLKSKMELVIEKVEAAKSEIARSVSDLDKKLTREIEVLKTVIHSQSTQAELKGDILSSLGREIKENNLVIADVKRNIENISDLKNLQS